jgi:EAL domain-containing protein (putative c-di-GMP-specific phosphodiesterase class I)
MTLDSAGTARHHSVYETEFLVHYQPVIELRTMDITGVEALVRIVDEGKFLDTGLFTVLAEKSGHILELGESVMKTACHQASDWLARFGRYAPPRLAVNLSTVQLLDSHIVQTIETALAASGLPPDCLDLEITETAPIEVSKTVTARVCALRELGVHLGLDDFGTGYSSFKYLRDFPVDFLKVDSTFVHGMASNTRDRAIVRSIVELGRDLDMRVIAEGVETQEQSFALTSTGIELAQGYLFAPALPPHELESFLLGNRYPVSN